MSDSLLLDTLDSLLLESGSDTLLLESVASPSLYVPSYVYWTDFREYRRGRLPGDFTQRVSTVSSNVRVEASAQDGGHRNRLLLSGSGTRTVHTWDAPDLDAGRATQEMVAVVRFTGTSPLDRTVACLRVHSSADTYYRAQFLTTTQAIRITKVIAGVSTTLQTGAKTLKPGVFYVVYFSAISTTLGFSVWALGDTPPVSWNIQATDSSITDGSIGFQSNDVASSVEQWEVYYLSAATSGATALLPDPDILDEPMSAWLSENDEEIETLLRFEYYDPDSDSVQEEWYSSHGRSTSAYSDYPSSTLIHKLPSWTNQPYSLGTWSTGLEADVHLGGAASLSRSMMRFANTPTNIDDAGPFDHWINKSFTGRPVERRVGKRWQERPTLENPNGVLTPLRRFEIQGCALISREPGLNLEECTVQLSAPTDVLSKTIAVNRNIGISTCAQTLSNSGYILIPSHAQYATNSFCIYSRIFLPITGVAGTGIGWFTRRFTGSSFQWSLSVGYASNATIPHKLNLVVHASDDTVLIDYVYPTPINDGLNHDVIFGLDDKRRWYLLIDGVPASGASGLTKSVKQPGTAVELLRVLPNCCIFDHRIEKFVNEDDALARFSARREPDLITISMHRVDDALAATVTDYASIANHGTLQGSQGSDWDWVPTYLGSSEVTGTSMPFSGGVLYHAPTQPVDSVRGVFRFNDRAQTVGAAVNIRAKGLTLTGGGVSYSEPPDGPGTVDFIGAVDQPITFGLTPNPSSPENDNIHVPKLVRDELISRRALTSSTCDQESFGGLRQLLPMKGGFYYQEPPTVMKFLTDQLGPIGAYFSLDRDARVYGGCLLPPINPNPYGEVDNCLEFFGLPHRGVTVNPNSAYSLKQDLTWSLQCWVKFHRHPIDPAVSSTFTHFPSGMTLIDHIDGASGYYLGIDGRDGYLVFGAPGITGTVSGLHYLKYTHIFEMNRWYLIQGYQDTNTRILRVGVPGEISITRTISETTTGTLTASDNAALRIGHGPRGNMYGSIMYAIGSSVARNESKMAADLITGPTLATAGSSIDRWFLDLRDNRLGESPIDRVYEQAQGKYGVTEGTRWCPRLHIDLRSSASAQLSDLSVPLPLWRLDPRYKINRSPLVGANVAAGVSSSDRIALSLPHLSEPDSSISIRDNYLNSKDASLVTPLTTSTDADYAARLVRERVATGRRFADVTNWYREISKLDLTDEVIIWHTRLGLDVGTPARAAILSSNEDLTGDVTAWG